MKSSTRDNMFCRFIYWRSSGWWSIVDNVFCRFIYWRSSCWWSINRSRPGSCFHYFAQVLPLYPAHEIYEWEMFTFLSCQGCRDALGKKEKKKVCLMNFCQKSYVLCFFFFLFSCSRKWAMRNAEIHFFSFLFFFSVFGPLFFFLPLQGHFFVCFVFFLATKKK